MQNEMEQTLINTYLKHTAKIFEEMTRHSGLHAEVLNSIEDLKLLSSSTPNTVHDLFPLIEKLAEDTNKIPDDIGSYTAGLEENLCINLETSIQGFLLKHFESLDQRIAVLKKYVKRGNRRKK